jgi:hypothetical protein
MSLAGLEFLCDFLRLGRTVIGWRRSREFGHVAVLNRHCHIKPIICGVYLRCKVCGREPSSSRCTASGQVCLAIREQSHGAPDASGRGHLVPRAANVCSEGDIADCDARE